MDKRERIIFILGVVFPGGLFGAVFFHNIPEFWIPAPVWGIPGALCASLVLSLPFIFGYLLQPKLKVGVFSIALVLAVILVMWVDAEYNQTGPIGSSSTIKSILINIQTVSNWQYRSFALIPVFLTVSGHWICGMFALSLARFFPGMNGKTSSLSVAKQVFSFVGVVALIVFTIGSMTQIKSGPVYVTGTLFGQSGEIRDRSVRELQSKMLEYVEALTSVDTFVAHIDEDHDFAKSIFEKQVLLEVTQKGFWWRGKWRKALINELKGFEGTWMLVLDDSDRPDVLVQPVYKSVEQSFVIDEKIILELGIDKKTVVEAVDQKLRMLLHRDLPVGDITIFIGDQGIPLSALGSFQTVRTEFKASELPKPRWEPLSLVQKEYRAGISIILAEDNLRAFGLNVNDVIAVVKAQLAKHPQEFDITLFSQSILAETKNGEKLRLRDAAEVIKRPIREPQDEINGIPYEIRLN